MSVPNGAAQQAPTPRGGRDPVQVLMLFLSRQQDLAQELATFQWLLETDPEIARKIAVLAQTEERGGIQAAISVLQELTQARQAQMQASGQPVQPGMPPQQPGMPPDPAQMGAAAPVEGGGPPPVPPDPALQAQQQAIAPPPQTPMPPGSPQNPGAMQQPPPGAVQPPPDPGMNAPGGGAGSMQELLAELPPAMARVVRSLREDQQQQVLQLYMARGIGVVQALLQQYMAAQGMGNGPQAMPGDSKKDKKEESPYKNGRRKKRDKSTPNFELDDLPPNKWGANGPSYATCRRHLDRAKTIWQPRDIRIQEDVDLYNLSRTRTAELPMGPRPGKPFDQAQGDIIHVSSRPFQFVERVTSYCTPTGDRKPTTDCPTWADDDETINASQALEDWLNYTRNCDEEASFRTGANGDPRMPLPRLEAGGMALMGGAGFQVRFNPKSKRHPVKIDYIPINRLYPLPGLAMMYSETLTLSEARNAWVEIEEYYRKFDNTGQAPDENMKVTIGSWTDVYPDGQGGLWHCIFWVAGQDEGFRYGDGAEEKRAKWIKEPTRIDFGFSPYQYVIWGGAPYYNTEGITDYERFRGMGCLTALRRTFKLMDLLWSATATGALKAIDPAIVQYYLPGTDPKDMKRHLTGAGKTNYALVGEKVEPLLWTFAGTPDGQAILQALWQEISDMDSPLLKGMSTANSNIQQTTQASAAGSVSVNPIIDALERMYQLQNTLRIELLIRKGGEGELGKIPYPSRPADDQFDMIWPSYKSLTPEMAKLNGTQNTVTINRLTLMEQQLLWNMLSQAVQSKMLNARDAMKKMGIANPQRNLLRILQEAAVMDQNALKAMMGAAIMGGDNALFQIGWQQVLMSQQQGGPPQAAPNGIPSAVAPSGGSNGAPPTEATQPGMM